MIEGMDKFSNLLSFEQDHEEIKEEIVDNDVKRKDDLSFIVQTPSNYVSMNKRTLSWINTMYVDDENSNKRMKTPCKGEKLDNMNKIWMIKGKYLF